MRIFLLISVLFLASACSSSEKPVDQPLKEEQEENKSLMPKGFKFWKTSEKKIEKIKEDPTAEDLYNKAMDYLENSQFELAVENFEELDKLYPFSKWSTKGQVMTAFAFFRDEEFEDAVTVIEHFLKVHPGHDDAPYMFYLKSMCYYQQIADVRRDQKITQRALQSLQEVVRRFKGTDYARDAKLKIDLVNDHLAGKEMEIGRFYLKRKKFIAAINRFRKVVEEFDHTSHTPEALYRLTESYLLIGVVVEAQKNAAVLGHNYPESKWYSYAYDLMVAKNHAEGLKKPGFFEKMFTFDSKDNEEMPEHFGTDEVGSDKGETVPDKNSWGDRLRNVFD